MGLQVYEFFTDDGHAMPCPTDGTDGYVDYEDLPRWRTVKDDGMPKVGQWVFLIHGSMIDKARIWAFFNPNERRWDVIGRGGIPVWSTHRWIPLADLRKLPGGE